MRALIVEDEPDVRALVRESLRYVGGEVIAIEAGNGEEALRLVRAEPPDIVLLDVALPGRDGFSVLSELRRRTDVPVILLTARGLEEDKIRGLRLGADDYVTKPFSPRELSARVAAVLRRGGARTALRGEIEHGDLRIDLGGHRVIRGGTEIRLTPTEFDLLAELAVHPGEALSHEDLLTRVWGNEYRSETHYLKVYVGRLRDKLETDPDAPKLIVTVRGTGYRFASSSEVPDVPAAPRRP